MDYDDFVIEHRYYDFVLERRYYDFVIRSRLFASETDSGTPVEQNGTMTFTGFGPEAAKFLEDLTADNSRTFFEANRPVYRDGIRQPLEDLLGWAEPVYGPGRVMRPNRDVRFSNDKAPYKTAASIWAGAVGGVYLSLHSTHLDVGGGVYGPSRDQLARARAAIDSQPEAATKLAAIVDAMTRAGFEMAGPFLTTAPRGFDRDHPQIGLLRLKHFAALKPLPVTATRDDVLAGWKAVEPLIAWCNQYIGAPLSWP